MVCQELVDRLMLIYTPTALTKEKAIIMLDDALTHVHQLFPIHREQAIICAEGKRNIYRLNGNLDPNVAMACSAKLGTSQTTTIRKYTYQQFKELKETYNDMLSPYIFPDKLDPIFDEQEDTSVQLSSYAVFQDIYPPINNKEETVDSKQFKIFPYRMEVLQLLECYKECEIRLGINSPECKVLSTDIIHIPNAVEGEIYVVEYTPKPFKIEIIQPDSWIEVDKNDKVQINYDKWWRYHADVPDTLIDLVMAYCVMKLTISTHGSQQFFAQNATNNYNNELQKAMSNMSAITAELTSNEFSYNDNIHNKGFY